MEAQDGSSIASGDQSELEYLRELLDAARQDKEAAHQYHEEIALVARDALKASQSSAREYAQLLDAKNAEIGETRRQHVLLTENLEHEAEGLRETVATQNRVASQTRETSAVANRKRDELQAQLAKKAGEWHKAQQEEQAKRIRIQEINQRTQAENHRLVTEKRSADEKTEAEAYKARQEELDEIYARSLQDQESPAANPASSRPGSSAADHTRGRVTPLPPAPSPGVATHGRMIGDPTSAEVRTSTPRSAEPVDDFLEEAILQLRHVDGSGAPPLSIEGQVPPEEKDDEPTTQTVEDGQVTAIRESMAQMQQALAQSIVESIAEARNAAAAQQALHAAEMVTLQQQVAKQLLESKGRPHVHLRDVVTPPQSETPSVTTTKVPGVKTTKAKEQLHELQLGFDYTLFREDITGSTHLHEADLMAAASCDKEGKSQMERCFCRTTSMNKRKDSRSMDKTPDSGRNSYYHVRPIIENFQFPKFLDSPDREVAAKVWDQFRPKIFRAIREPLEQGCCHIALLRALQTTCGDAKKGNVTMSCVMDEAEKDECMHAKPLFHWDCIFCAMDRVINVGTKFGGDTANMKWDRCVDRKTSETLEMLVKRVIEAYCISKSKDFHSFKLADQPPHAFQELATKFQTCLESDAQYPERGVVLGRAFAKEFLQTMMLINAGEGDGVDEAEAARCIDGNLRRIVVRKLRSVEAEWLREYTENKSKVGFRDRDRERVRAAERDPDGHDRTNRPRDRVAGMVAPVSNNAHAPPAPSSEAIPTPKSTKNHPYGNFNADASGAPCDSDLRGAYNRAKSREDTGGIVQINAIMARGQREVKTQMAATQVNAAYSPAHGQSQPTTPRHPPAHPFAPPTYERRVNPLNGDLPRESLPPAGSKGNHEGHDWTPANFNNYLVNLDDLDALCNENAEACEVLSKGRPYDEKRNSYQSGRVNRVEQGSTYDDLDCRYCKFRPKAKSGSPQADLSHPDNWKYGVGTGGHNPRYCPCFKRWCAEGGGDDTHSREIAQLIQKCHSQRPPRTDSGAYAGGKGGGGGRGGGRGGPGGRGSQYGGRN